jgi:hypothetical protein
MKQLCTSSEPLVCGGAAGACLAGMCTDFMKLKCLLGRIVHMDAQSKE